MNAFFTYLLNWLTGIVTWTYQHVLSIRILNLPIYAWVLGFFVVVLAIRVLFRFNPSVFGSPSASEENAAAALRSYRRGSLKDRQAPAPRYRVTIKNYYTGNRSAKYPTPTDRDAPPISKR